jgi:hypothetical protein
MDGQRRREFRPIYLLLILPLVAQLWVPFYNSAEPALDGVPFFYWYQILWVALTALCLFIVYRADGAK